MARSRRLAPHRTRRSDLRGGLGVQSAGDTTTTSLGSTVTFPGAALAFQVMIALGANPSASPDLWIWTDITRYVFFDPGIDITRGQADERVLPAPSQCSLTLRNFDPADPTLDGLFSPRNPNGPYYGQFGRNTPIRVDVDPGTGWVRRFTGFVSNWPPRWDISGRVKYIRIQADGVTRRLGQARSPLRSAVVRSITGAADLVAYWPMEDDVDANRFASYLTAPDAVVSGTTVTLAADSTAAGSLPLPTFGADSAVSLRFTATTAMTQWRTTAAITVSAIPATTVALLDVLTTGTVVQWRVTMTPGTPVSLNILGYNSAGTAVVSVPSAITLTVAEFYGSPAMVMLAVLPSATPGAIDWALEYTESTVGNNGSGRTGTLAAATVGTVTSIARPADANLPLGTFGHAAVFANGDFASTAAAIVTATGANQAWGLGGYSGELAAFRFLRLCVEAGVSRNIVGTLGAATMGPQPRDTILNAIQECQAADNGVITEGASGKLFLYNRAGFENQTVDLTVDYDLQQVAPPFSPAEDDQRTRNDVTASRPSATSSPSRQFDKTGPLGTDTIGTYDDSVTVNVDSDTQLVEQASYRVVHGTVDEARYPQVTLNLTRSPTLITAWLACDIGARINVLNTPVDDGPGVVDQVMLGYTEHLDPIMWTAQLNCVPFSPHRVFRLASATGDADEFLGYMIPTTCTLAEDLDTTETAVDITTDPLWSTDPDDWSPAVKVSVGGEDMLVSEVAGASNPQTLTVTRSVNGIVKTHTTGDALEFATPGILGL